MNSNYVTYDIRKKNLAVAFILWSSLGQAGGHNFYMGRIPAGVIQLILAIVGYATIWFFLIGLIFLIPLWIWLIIDAYLLTGWVAKHNTALMQSLEETSTSDRLNI